MGLGFSFRDLGLLFGFKDLGLGCSFRELGFGFRIWLQALGIFGFRV